jgi:hypothetical protein
MAVRAGVFAVVDIAPVQQRIVLAVRGNQAARRFDSPHGPAHVVFLLNAAPVVGKPGDFSGECPVVRQFPTALLSDGDATVGQNGDERGISDEFKLALKMRRAVRRRLDVGHGADKRKAAARRGRRGRRNRLLIRKSGLPQMNVHICESRNNKRMRQIKNRIKALRRNIRCNIEHNAAGNGQSRKRNRP